MKTRNIVIGLILCTLVINITLILMVSVVCAAPIKQFDAHEKKLTITDDSGAELQIKSISIKEGVCQFEEVFEVTAIDKDYTPSKNKDFKLGFKNKKKEDAKHKITTEEWFVWEDNEWKQLKWNWLNKAKKIKKDETKLYKVVVTKQAELGNKRILTVPSFMGVEDERLSWWNVSWQYRINSTLDTVPSGGYVYNLTVHSGSGTNNQTDVFLNSYNATNFSDIRFVLDDTTELSYWIEDKLTDPIKVWLNVTDNGTVYIYYGNSDVETTANGFGVFAFFDDFEDGDVSDWICYKDGTGDCSLETGYNSSYSYQALANDQDHTTDNIELRHTVNLELDCDYNLLAWVKDHYVEPADTTYIKVNSTTLGSKFGTDWLKVVFDISSFNGSTITLKFGAQNYYTGWNAFIRIDNVFIHRVVSPEPLWSTWSLEETEELPLSNLEYNTQRKLARTSEGYLHRVYTKFDGSNYRVYYAKSTDTGSTWTEMVLTDAGVNNTHPAIASDSEDNLWVVYEREGSGVWYRKYEGLSWQAEEIISGGFWGLEPVIAVDNDDNIHVAWYSDFVGYLLRYREYNGTAWEPIENVRVINFPKHMSIATDINNYVHVVWQEENTTTNTQNIKHSKKTSTWQPVYNITSGETYDQTYPCIATDLSGNAHIVWQTQDHQIKSIKYEAAGTWEAIKTVHNGGIYEQRNPSISVYSDSNVYATWYGKTATYNESYIIRESHKTTGTWSSALDILYPSGKDVVCPNLVSALYPKICSDCYTNIPNAGYTFVYDEDSTINYYESGDLAWRCPTKYVLTIKAINTKTGADVTSFSADIGTGETKTTTTGIIKFRCLDTGYYNLKVTATEYYTYIDNIVIDATKEITIPLTSITEADYFLPKTKTVTFTVRNMWGTEQLGNVYVEDVYVEAVGYNITHPEGWLGHYFGFDNVTEIYNTTQSGTTDSEGQIVFVMVETIKYKLTFVKEDVGINKTWFKYPTRDEYTIVIWAWEYPEEGTEEILETTLNITTSTINDTHALIHVNYTDPSNLTSSLNINITRLTTFNREEIVRDYTVTNESIVHESFIVTPYQGRSFNIKITALHEKWGEKIWEYGIKFKGLLSDLELPEKMYPIIVIALIFFIGGFFGASTALQGSLVVCMVSWIFYGIGWLSLASDVVMISALSLATVMSVLGLLMDRGRKAGVQ